MSVDDAETMAAAEALSGLRNTDYKSSSSSIHSSAQTLKPMEDEPEPLLSLITSSHPWVGGAVNSSLYAYNSTMHYTPGFIQSLIEKPVCTVASGLGTVSRKTGVESRVRQYFGDTQERRNARETARASQKRPREPSPSQQDLEMGMAMSPPHSRQRSRTSSQASHAETLPAYDNHTAPAYEKQSQLAVQQQPRNWKSQLMITTSGLGVALSDASLRSLKYCLSFLRQATGHLAEIMAAIRSLLVEYEQSVYQAESSSQAAANLTPEQDAAAQMIAERIKSLGSEIMNTIQNVTANVSRYAGGALPENASALVRRQLLSVPQRWRIAQEASSPPSPHTTDVPTSTVSSSNEAVRTGQRWLVFAEQGCDMIAQVSLVLGGTVDSAEKWLDSMGRRRASIASSSNDSRVRIGNTADKVHEPFAFPTSEKR